LPLDSERLGSLGRLMPFLRGSKCLGRPEGVLVPFEEVPEGSLEEVSSLALFLASSSFLRSISACFSSSDVSSSLYGGSA